MDRLCGIYCIENIKTGQYYIGSSININERFWHHMSDLKNNRHRNGYLQNSYNKYGVQNFKYSILEFSTPDKLRELEHNYLTTFYCKNHIKCFNICETTDGPMGMKHTDETKLKMSKNNARYWLGKKKPQELCERMSKARIGCEFPTRHKPILKLSLDGTILEEFNTLKTAMQIYGKGVWAAAVGRVKTSAGYKWKYKQDLNVQ